jgi:hypothetical protein
LQGFSFALYASALQADGRTNVNIAINVKRHAIAVANLASLVHAKTKKRRSLERQHKLSLNQRQLQLQAMAQPPIIALAGALVSMGAIAAADPITAAIAIRLSNNSRHSRFKSNPLRSTMPTITIHLMMKSGEDPMNLLIAMILATKLSSGFPTMTGLVGMVPANPATAV